MLPREIMRRVREIQVRTAYGVLDIPFGGHPVEVIGNEYFKQGKPFVSFLEWKVQELDLNAVPSIYYIRILI